MNFTPNAKKQNADSYKKSALMGIQFGLQRHFLLKGNLTYQVMANPLNQIKSNFEAAIVALKQQRLGKVDHVTTQYQRKISKRSSPPTTHLLQLQNH